MKIDWEGRKSKTGKLTEKLGRAEELMLLFKLTLTGESVDDNAGSSSSSSVFNVNDTRLELLFNMEQKSVLSAGRTNWK